MGLRYVPELRLQSLLAWLVAAVGGPLEDVVVLLGRPHRYRAWCRLNDSERGLLERIEALRAEWLTDFQWDHLTYFCQDVARGKNFLRVCSERN